MLGQPDLLRIAILLAALPLGCAIMLTRARYRLGLTRTVHPARVTAGESVRVRLELHNLARLGTRVLLAEDRVPYVLGAPPALRARPAAVRAAGGGDLLAAVGDARALPGRARCGCGWPTRSGCAS